MNRIVSIYKPKGPTSHDVVNEVRKITGEKKVGHAGTLDPLASGVLVVGIGREATKRLGEVVEKDKEYLATFKLGQTSTTDDEEGEKRAQEVGEVPTKDKIEEVLTKFIGEIEQTPPAYSAVKIEGKEAYKRARGGEEVKPPPRIRQVKKIDLIEYEWPLVRLRVTTGPGVYIRSLARDVGAALGVGAYLAELERTRVGRFTKENSYTLGLLKTKWAN